MADFRLGLLVLVLTASIAAATPTTKDLNHAWRAYAAALESDDRDEILETSRQVLDIGRQYFPADDHRLPVLLNNHAVALAKSGHTADAIPLFEQSLKDAEDIHGEESPELLALLLPFAAEVGDPKDPRRQQKIYQRVLKIHSTHHSDEDVRYANLAFIAGSRLLDDSRSMSGRKYMRQAHDIFMTLGDEGRSASGMSAFYLGKFAYSTQNNKRAVEYFEYALTALDTDVALGKAQSLAARSFLVGIYERRGDSELATKHCVEIGRDSMFDPNQDYLPLFRRAPEYPSSKLLAGMEGYVDVEFTVDELGFVRNAMIRQVVSGRNIDWSDPDKSRNPASPQDPFEKAAIEAVEAFRYAPRFVDGEATATDGVSTRISFRIE